MVDWLAEWMVAKMIALIVQLDTLKAVSMVVKTADWMVLKMVARLVAPMAD